MLYRFDGPYPRFYPEVKGPDGRSLEAFPGDVMEFPDSPPGDGCWVIPEDSPPVPEKPEATFQAKPAPEPGMESPEPSAAPEGASAPVPASKAKEN